MSGDAVPLLARIEALAIDPPGARLSFVARLARENGWTLNHARRVDREYRRFLFMAATGDRAVTPSDAVDQAWHLHLAYTRSYWNDLCGDVIGQPLHHGPTAGGTREHIRYREQYQATLDRYAALFGPPPADIWPATEARYSTRFVRIDRATSWVLPRRATFVVGAAPVAGVGLAAATDTSGGWIAFAVLLAVFGVVALIAGVRSAQRKGKQGDGGGCGSSGCGSSRDSDASSDSGDSGCGGGGGCGGGD